MSTLQPVNPEQDDDKGPAVSPLGDQVSSPESLDQVDGQLETPSEACQRESAAKSPQRPGGPLHIVGVGASAGGLEALEAFFDHMPTDTGMAFVVVQHLSPDFKSVMDELLARHTKIPIHRVTDGIQVEPNAIYLIPPKKEMVISGGRLLLNDKEPGSGLNLPIDIFFRSLAQDAGPCAVGVILSGTGSDGSRGITHIKEAEGFVVCQDLDSAKFDGMPKSAIATGVVDLALRPEQIPAALLSHIQHPAASEAGLGNAPALLEGFDAIFQLLRKHYDIDFSHYKRPTVSRRVQRRLQMNQITDIEEYVERLRKDSGELNLLYRDLLIGVTKFLRDREAFNLLEGTILPELLAKAKRDGELRIWIAGCATGEEAYSIAILLHEQLSKLEKPPQIKVFATDVHRASLTFASAGVYSEASLSEVSQERLGRYFSRVKGGFQVSQDLRQLIVFAPHNLIKDAPFTKIDLITCRNLLIYLEPIAQKRVISLFHFALNTGGVMMLGPSETLGTLDEDFASIDDRWKVYRKRRDKRLSPDARLPLSAGYVPSTRANYSTVSSTPAPPDGPLLRVYDELLKSYAPPSLLINERRELVQSFSGASQFLRMKDGRPSADVFELVVSDLKIPMSTAVLQAAKKQTAVTFTGVRVRDPAGEKLVKLSVKPFSDAKASGEFYLVSIEPVEEISPPAERNGHGKSEVLDLSQASKDQLQAVELELRYAKENLQATVEEMETSNEELQATNEELVASNEELQSTNEELHSVNEELYTVNAEYQKKIDELTLVTADLENLLQSTEVGVVFLDHDLCVRKFTPRMAEVFHLLPVDIGRRIDSFSHNIQRAELLDDLRKVLRDQKPIEMEVEAGDGSTYLLRILPYRSKTKIDGVVLTLIDISQLKQTETDLKLMSKVFLDGADPIVIEDLEGRITDLNAEAVRVFGWPREELLGKSIDALIPEGERLRARELRERCIERGGLRNIETTNCNRVGGRIPVLLTLSVLTNRTGQPIALASSVKDITDRRRAEETARDAVRKRDQFLAMLSHELRNPLGAALNATYVFDFALNKEASPQVREACGVIQRQMLQVANLLDDLLDVSRITQGKIQIRKERVDLSLLVDDAIGAVKPLIDAQGHQLRVEASESPICVEGDVTRLLQVFGNLLANAAKYTPHGGEILLSLTKEDGEALIRVRDNGRGIPKHMLESIFEMFVQTDDSLDRTRGGMGIGLTLVRTLVELHGGQIKAYSKGANQGSEFVVRLPLMKLQNPEHCDDSEAPVVKPTQKHIVIVEDNDDSRQMMEALLKLEGHLVSSANNGRQGLEMIQHLRPDAAIVDIGLPEVSGYELAHCIRQEAGGKIYLIALTGYGRAEDREAALKAGFHAHLVKPLKPLELERVLHEAAKNKIQVLQGG